MELDEFLTHTVTDAPGFPELNGIDEFIVSSGAMHDPIPLSSQSIQHQVGPGASSVRVSGGPDLSARNLMADQAPISVKRFRPIIPVGVAHLVEGAFKKPKRYTIFLEDATNC